VKLGFLGEGSWTPKLWKDAPDRDAKGGRLLTEQGTVAALDELTLRLARAGGAVACFDPATSADAGKN
jgi:hypothetical protein